MNSMSHYKLLVSGMDASAGGITQAVDRAIATVNRYEFNGTNATIARSDVRFAAQLTDFDAGPGLDETNAKAAAATVRFVKGLECWKSAVCSGCITH